MLTAENISYIVKDRAILQDISATFHPGELTTIIGPNGAGKSSLLRIISGMVKPATGDVTYHTGNTRTLALSELARIRAVLSQNTELAFPIGVEELVLLGRYPHNQGHMRSADMQALDEVFAFCGITDLRHRNYFQLSEGEKQRIQLARVLAQIWFPPDPAPRYLLLDEPLTYLDLKYQIAFMNILRELRKTRNIVIIAIIHDLNLAAKFSDKLLLMNNGKILASGDKFQVFTEENIRNAYDLTVSISNIKGEITLTL